MKRCPMTAAKRCATENRVMKAYSFLKNHNVMPETGGLNDQAATFVEASLILSRVFNDLERDKIEKTSNKGKKNSSNSGSKEKIRYGSR